MITENKIIYIFTTESRYPSCVLNCKKTYWMSFPINKKKLGDVSLIMAQNNDLPYRLMQRDYLIMNRANPTVIERGNRII